MTNNDCSVRVSYDESTTDCTSACRVVRYLLIVLLIDADCLAVAGGLSLRYPSPRGSTGILFVFRYCSKHRSLLRFLIWPYFSFYSIFTLLNGKNNSFQTSSQQWNNVYKYLFHFGPNVCSVRFCLLVFLYTIFQS